LIVTGLWSRDVTTALGSSPSDGRQLFRLLFKPLPEPQVRRQLYFQTRANWNFDLDQTEEMVAVLDEGLQEFPSDKVLRGAKATGQVGLGQYEAARETLLTLLAEHADKDAHRAMLDNNLAWTDLMSERAEWLPEADVASAEAYALLPWVPAIQSTRGLLLVETGRIDEGIRLLKRALAGAERRVSKASTLCSLAVAECYRGNAQTAQLLAARARRCSPRCEVLPRIEKLLANAPQQTVIAA
jgi:predicted Zn-dependent protease